MMKNCTAAAGIENIPLLPSEITSQSTEETYPKYCDICPGKFFSQRTFAIHKINGKCVRFCGQKDNSSYPRTCGRCLRICINKQSFHYHKKHCVLLKSVQTPKNSVNANSLNVKSTSKMTSSNTSQVVDTTSTDGEDSHGGVVYVNDKENISDIDRQFIIAIHLDSNNQHYKSKSMYPRICEYCHKLFTSRSSFCNHKLRRMCGRTEEPSDTAKCTKMYPRKCIRCGKVIKNRQLYHIHKKRCFFVDTGASYPRACANCVKTFNDANAYYDHKVECDRKHNVIKDNDDPTCQEIIFLHQVKRSVYPRQCERCKRNLLTKQAYYKHKKRCLKKGVIDNTLHEQEITQHTVQENETEEEQEEKLNKYPRECKKCNRIYSSRQSFSNHKSKCVDSLKQIQCEYCQLLCEPESYTKHMETCKFRNDEKILLDGIPEENAYNEIEETIVSYDELHETYCNEDHSVCKSNDEVVDAQISATEDKVNHPRKCSECSKMYANWYTFFKHKKNGCSRGELSSVFRKEQGVPNLIQGQSIQEHIYSKRTFDDTAEQCSSAALSTKNMLPKPVVKIVYSKKCEKCGNLFIDESVYKEHLRICGENESAVSKINQPFPNVKAVMKFTYMGKCKKCEKWFGSETVYREHVKTCNGRIGGDPCILCDKCKKICNDENTYNMHMETCGTGEPVRDVSLFMEKLLQHTNSRKCCKCQKVFEKGTAYDDHIKMCDLNFTIFITKIATPSKNACEKCNHQFVNQEDYATHVSTCNASSKDNKGTDILEDFIHPPLDTESSSVTVDKNDNCVTSFKCQHCSERFSNEPVYNEHTNKVKCFCCLMCFCNENAYKRHVMKFVCKICRTFFCNQESIKAHFLQRKCTDCERCFCTDSSYQEHLALKCENCKSAFCKDSALQEHTKECRKLEFAFKCERCDSVFSSEKLLTEHFCPIANDETEGMVVHVVNVENTAKSEDAKNMYEFRKFKISYPRKCHKCNQYYSSRQTFSKHRYKTCDRYKNGSLIPYTNTAPTRGRRFGEKIVYPRKCVHCPKMFSCKQTYSKHLSKGKCNVKNIIKVEHNFSLQPEFSASVQSQRDLSNRESKTIYPKTCENCQKICTYRQQYYLHRQKCVALHPPDIQSKSDTDDAMTEADEQAYEFGPDKIKTENNTSVSEVVTLTEVSGLDIHFDNRSNEINFFKKCNNCEGYFKTKETYDRHKVICNLFELQAYGQYRAKISGNTSYPKFCECCQRIFKSKQGFYNHKRSCHFYCLKYFIEKTCDSCKKPFRCEKIYSKHKLECSVGSTAERECV